MSNMFWNVVVMGPLDLFYISDSTFFGVLFLVDALFSPSKSYIVCSVVIILFSTKYTLE